MKKGQLECIVGPMYASKSRELINRINRAKYANKAAVIFKPAIDNRYDKSDVVSHDGLRVKAKAVKTAKEILNYYIEDYDIVAIDEAQFFDKDIVEVVKELIKRKRVIVAGLDLDFRRKPFGYIPQLLAMAKFVTKLKAVCEKCGADALYTQRIVNNKPASLDGETIIVGGAEQYKPRCEDCWEGE